ncbi:hypothetical protein [Haladaptatus halobius]|uniref:hypothetical protein n=1 Tax=Haladaptatus halobius TaxID=2884875 RepID=UPI001D0BA049|nr:hypothetical protein [Haladaptatus halobius]
MKKAILFSLIIAVLLVATFAGPGIAAPITASDAGDSVVTNDATVTPNAYCVDDDCDCRYDPNTGEYFGDC